MISKTTFYQRNRDVLPNRAKQYYQNNKEVLRKKARNTYRELSDKQNNNNNKKEYGRNRYHMYKEENRKLKEYQKKFRI